MCRKQSTPPITVKAGASPPQRARRPVLSWQQSRRSMHTSLLMPSAAQFPTSSATNTALTFRPSPMRSSSASAEPSLGMRLPQIHDDGTCDLIEQTAAVSISRHHHGRRRFVSSESYLEEPNNDEDVNMNDEDEDEDAVATQQHDDVWQTPRRPLPRDFSSPPPIERKYGEGRYNLIPPSLFLDDALFVPRQALFPRFDMDASYFD